MPLFSKPQRQFAETVSRLIYSNPFLPERIELEKQALGPHYQADQHTVWSLIPNAASRRDNVDLLDLRVRELADRTRDQLRKGRTVNPRELELYHDLVLHLLYYRSFGDWFEFDTATEALRPRVVRAADWKRFQQDYHDYLVFRQLSLPQADPPEVTYALLNQVCRAFFNIYQGVIGQSLPSARLRATIWESIFTFDVRRYRRSLIGRMGDIATLIVGPSGTGKELVARAIGHSRFIHFDPGTAKFVVDAQHSFVPLNLSAISPTLIESELFGHAAGAFTGAGRAHRGWLEKTDRYGSVFLDEIGELDTAIQVKLLRLLQDRQFQRVGETRSLDFHGKIISATNRNLEREMAAGNFREDFYYRLCSDFIRTPSLQEQLGDKPDDLEGLIEFLTARMMDDPQEQSRAVAYVHEWITRKLPANYHWPGNVRELEQCVRNILVHNTYRPRPSPTPAAAGILERLGRDFSLASQGMDDMQSRYCTLAYWQTGSFERAAQRLGIDRRTVRARLDETLLLELQQSAARRPATP